MKQFLKFSVKFNSNLVRKPFKTLSSSDVQYFQSFLHNSSVLTQNLDGYNVSYTKLDKGHSGLVLKPSTTEEVSKIMKYCFQNNLAVVPQGGNTGLTGGSNPVFDEIILSLTKMKKIISFDPISATLHCEAGCILEVLNKYLEEKNYTMPLDLAAKGSCLIGGNIATNAGGINLVQFGPLRQNIKGLKAVLPNGDIIDSMNPLPKNNTGYDLKQLFIGSEGTLGIITECLVNTPILKKNKDVLFVALDSFDDCITTLKITKEKLLSSLNAIEFLDGESMRLLNKYGKVSPFNAQFEYYVLIEIASNNSDNQAVLEELSTLLPIQDGVIAKDENQRKKIWELREDITPVIGNEHIVMTYDISLPIEKFYEGVKAVRDRVGNKGITVGFGHLGDFNVHIFVGKKGFEKDDKLDEIEKLVEPFIYDYTCENKGSISAEHGIGLHKMKYMKRFHDKDSLNLMKIMKSAIDPKGILNPYKMFESDI